MDNNVQNPDDIPIRPMDIQNNYLFAQFSEVDEKQLILEEEKKPISERILSRFIEIKKRALAEILEKIKTLESKEHEEFDFFFGLTLSALEDKNPIIQEIALDLIGFITEKFEKNQSEIINSVFSKVLEKCYSSNKHSLNQKAKGFLVTAFQNSMDTKAIFEGMKTLLDSKLQKIPQITINFLTNILSCFGSFNMDYRGFLPLIEKICENVSIPLRKEIIEFYKELYKWIRGSLKASVLKLKQNYQVSEK
jgi:hypothetical protein